MGNFWSGEKQRQKELSNFRLSWLIITGSCAVVNMRISRWRMALYLALGLRLYYGFRNDVGFG